MKRPHIAGKLESRLAHLLGRRVGFIRMDDDGIYYIPFLLKPGEKRQSVDPFAYFSFGRPIQESRKLPDIYLNSCLNRVHEILAALPRKDAEFGLGTVSDMRSRKLRVTLRVRDLVVTMEGRNPAQILHLALAHLLEKLGPCPVEEEIRRDYEACQKPGRPQFWYAWLSNRTDRRDDEPVRFKARTESEAWKKAKSAAGERFGVAYLTKNRRDFGKCYPGWLKLQGW